MNSLNKVQLIGNLGSAPEIRHTQDGRKVANFNVATTTTWKNSNGEQNKKTEWHKISVFNEALANFAEQYLEKGSLVYIEGTLQNEVYTNKQGIDIHQTKIALTGYNSALTILNKKQSDNQYSDQYGYGNSY